MRKIFITLLLTVFIGLLPAAQQLQHEVAVTLKLIQVYVMDKAGDPVKDHDPFDPLGREPKAYRLVPLVYSAGPDGEFDIVAKGSGWSPTMDPYGDVTHNGTPVGPRGTPFDDEGDGENWHDNIHNHLLDVRK